VLKNLLARANLTMYLYDKGWPCLSLREAWTLAGLVCYQAEIRKDR